MASSTLPEVWLRGPVPEVPALLMPVAHALRQAREDLERILADVSTVELWRELPQRRHLTYKDSRRQHAFAVGVTMVPMPYVWLVGAIAVLLLDTIGAFASRQFGFSYAALGSVSYVLYFCIGIGGGRLGGIGAGLVAGGITALIDATVGWGISSLIGVGKSVMGLSMLAIGLTVLMIVCTGAVVGTLGGVVGYVVRRSIQADL